MPVPQPFVTGFPNSIAPFFAYCQKVLPAVYDDSLSYYENVCKMVAKLNEVIEYANLSGPAMEKLQAQIDDLNQQLEDFKEHGFDDYYKEQVAHWVADNLQYIMETVIRQVFFGLNMEGYFVAYIPESWSDIVFDTGAVYGTEEYGRLILLMNVNGVDWDDSTGNGNLPYLSELESRVENLERNVGINNKTLYTELAPDGRISLPPTGKRIENPLG